MQTSVKKAKGINCMVKKKVERKKRERKRRREKQEWDIKEA